MPEAVESGTLCVWDAEGSPATSVQNVLLWREFDDGNTPGIVSIPKLVEEHAESLRALYLAWVYELGENRIQGKRLVDHLKLRPEFSAWWMSLIAEMSYGKSPSVYDAIRMMAFQHWVAKCLPARLLLVSPNTRLAKCMSSWCGNSGVEFEWHRLPDKKKCLSWAKCLYGHLPHSIQAIIWLVRHFLQCWPLRGVGLLKWRKTKGQITFISYLFNLVPDAEREGRFESCYWGDLPDNLQSAGCKTNWLHLYVKNDLLPTAKMAANAIQNFNKTGQDGQTHVTLESFLDSRVIVRTLYDWSRLVWLSWRLRQSLSSKQETISIIWPLLEDDWRQSMSGVVSISNILSLNLFESALKSLPKQVTGVYLQENQGWEFALIHAWNDIRHGCLIGAPHATVRFWDLRYFFDPRSYQRGGECSLPLPDWIAFNGQAVRDAYQQGGYPAEDMVEVEALRYHHLVNARTGVESLSPPTDALRILVLGDYLVSNTQQQMRLLEKAAQRFPDNISITVKPHPACPIRPDDYPDLCMKITMAPISKLLPECDVAYTSNVTSAAVDVYCAGVPIVSMLDPNTLNLSPLRGYGGVVFVSTPEDLMQGLVSAPYRTRLVNKPQDFFMLDPQLPRWRKLLLNSVG